MCVTCFLRIHEFSSHHFSCFLLNQGKNFLLRSKLLLVSHKKTLLAPSSSKFNLKRHQKDINFRWLFHVFLGFWAQKPKNTRKSHRKLMSFRRLFRLNFEDEGAICVYFETYLVAIKFIGFVQKEAIWRPY